MAKAIRIFRSKQARDPILRVKDAVASLALGTLLFAAPASAADRSNAPALVQGAPVYVPFQPIFVPVIEGDRVTSQFGVTLMLQLVKGQTKDGVDEKRPELRDAFVQDLYGFFQQRAPLHQTINDVYLKDRLLESASAILGDGVVQEVLIEQLFQEQR